MKRIIVAVLLLVASASSFGQSALSQAAKLATIVTVTDPQFSGGAKCNGTHNDLAAIQAAIDTGKSVYFPSGTCYLGTFTSYANEVAVLTITGKSHVRYFGPGILKVTSGDHTVPKILTIDNSHDIDIDLGFEDDGYDDAVEWQGAMAINLLGSAGPVYNINAKVRGTSLIAGLNTGNQAATVPAEIIDGIHLDLTLYNIFYGAQFRESGTRVTGVVQTTDAHRSYFVYGGKHHDVIVKSDYHPVGRPQDVLVKAYIADTEDIRIKYSATRFTALTSPIYIGNQTTGSAVVRDVSIEMHDVSSTNSNSFSAFVEAVDAGGANLTTSTKVVTGLKFSGHMRFVPHVATKFTNATYSKQLTIELQGDVARKMLSPRPVVYGWSGTPMYGLKVPNNIRWLIGDRWHSFQTGLINSAQVEVPLAPNVNTVVPVTMRIIDAPFNSSAHLHRQTTYFTSTDGSGTVTVFGSGNDFLTSNGLTHGETITQGVAAGDSENVGAIKFTFSAWQTTPNGDSGYLHFSWPDQSRYEVAN